MRSSASAIFAAPSGPQVACTQTSPSAAPAASISPPSAAQADRQHTERMIARMETSLRAALGVGHRDLDHLDAGGGADAARGEEVLAAVVGVGGEVERRRR